MVGRVIIVHWDTAEKVNAIGEVVECQQAAEYEELRYCVRYVEQFGHDEYDDQVAAKPVRTCNIQHTQL